MDAHGYNYHCSCRAVWTNKAADHIAIISLMMTVMILQRRQYTPKSRGGDNGGIELDERGLCTSNYSIRCNWQINYLHLEKKYRIGGN